MIAKPGALKHNVRMANKENDDLSLGGALVCHCFEIGAFDAAVAAQENTADGTRRISQSPGKYFQFQHASTLRVILDPRKLRVAGHEVLLQLSAVLMPNNGDEEREAALNFRDYRAEGVRSESAKLMRGKTRPQINIDDSDSQSNSHVPQLRHHPLLDGPALACHVAIPCAEINAHAQP